MNAQEAMQALLDGKKIRKPFMGVGCYIRLVNGSLVNQDGNPVCLLTGSYEEYKESKWWDSIPSSGVLCWSRNHIDFDWNGPRIILKEINGLYVDNRSIYWKEAKPLTSDELNNFLFTATYLEDKGLIDGKS